MTTGDRSEYTLPRVVAIGLLMIGTGLIGMTAGDLPGIALQLEAPRWLLGVLGGVLVGSGWQAGHWVTNLGREASTPRSWTAAPWVELVLFGIGGIALAHLSRLTRADEGAGEALWGGVAINTLARVMFGIGMGLVVGWAAYEGSQSRGRGDS